ncbi:MAG: hypothetical protein Q8Q14_09975, partial [Gemmatimonadales bacterium]|nr:hypothetical protein [Gemmatimonadales bacterium]
MSDAATERMNVRLTLTCGNAKCAHVITSQVVVPEGAQAVEHMMATQQIQCPKCQKIGRNHVTHEETTEATYLRHQTQVAPDVPRRHREDHQRKMITPPDRASRR